MKNAFNNNLFWFKSIYGVIPAKAFNLRLAFLEISLMWASKVSFGSNLTPKSFSHGLLHIFWFSTIVLTLSSMLQMKWHLSGLAFFDYHKTAGKVSAMHFVTWWWHLLYCYPQHKVCYRLRSLQNQSHSLRKINHTEKCWIIEVLIRIPEVPQIRFLLKSWNQSLFWSFVWDLTDSFALILKQLC